MKKIKKYIPLIVIGVVVLIGVILVSLLYGDFLGTRVLRKASSRVVAYQGEKVTIQVADSASTRKLELCVEKKNLLLGYSDFSDCKTLQYVLGPHVKSANITIPSNFPLGRALVVTRVRDAQGNLIPVGPSDEKITLLIQKARPAVASHDEGSSSGGGGGGGGGGSSGGGGSHEEANNTPVVTPVPYELTHLCYESDKTVHVTWKPKQNGLRFRRVGESTWRPVLNECGFNGCPDIVYFDDIYLPAPYDYKNAIIYTDSRNPLEPNTDFEFQVVPYVSSPDDNPENSQLYRFNSGPLPTGVSECRSLL